MPGPLPKMTLPTQLVLQLFANQPDADLYGLEITAGTGLPSGTIHPILARLERAGWLTSSWEQIDTKAEGRPRRRYYRLDPNNAAAVQAALARVEAKTAAVHRLRPGLLGGSA